MKVSNYIAAAVAAASTNSPFEGTNLDGNPLMVIYYNTWVRWSMEYGIQELDKTILSRDLPVRNLVLNWSFFGYNPNDCHIASVDSGIDFNTADTTPGAVADWEHPTHTKSGLLPFFMKLKAKYPHVKLMPSLGGWSRSHTFHNCFHNNLDVSVREAVNLVKVWGFDGIDLDWEYPNCENSDCGCQNEPLTCSIEKDVNNRAGPGDWEQWKKYVIKLREEFDVLEQELKKPLYITAAIGMSKNHIDGGNDTWQEAMPVEWICETDYMSWVNTMAYDYYGGWDDYSGALAPLYNHPAMPNGGSSIDESLNAILSRCSRPEKFTLGLASYGKTYDRIPRGSNDSQPGFWQYTEADIASNHDNIFGPGTLQASNISYWDAKRNIEELNANNCEFFYDEITATQNAYCPKLIDGEGYNDGPENAKKRSDMQNVFLNYESPKSWKQKMAYARSRGMSGGIVWAAGDFGNGGAKQGEYAAEFIHAAAEGYTGKATPINPVDTLGKGFTYNDVPAWANYPCPIIPQDLYNVQLQHNCPDSYPTERFTPSGSGPTGNTGYNNKPIFPIGPIDGGETSSDLSWCSASNPSSVEPTEEPVPSTSAPSSSTSTSTTSSTTASTTSSTTITTSSTTTTVAPPSGECGNVPAWDPKQAYATTCTAVCYEGQVWYSQWYVNPGVVPGAAPYNGWDVKGNCQ